MKHLLRGNRGSVYIEFLTAFFGIMLCIAFALTVLPVFTAKHRLDYAADRLMRQAEVSGHTSLSVLADELRDETGIAFTVSWSGTSYMAGSTRVQLNHSIHLELTSPQSIGLNGIASYPIALKSRLSGASEVYFK